jgi:hypothetical protein
MRSWFRFSVREWFLVVVIIAVTLCWRQQAWRATRTAAQLNAQRLELSMARAQAASADSRLKAASQEFEKARREEWKGIMAQHHDQVMAMIDQHREQLAASDARLKSAQAKNDHDLDQYIARHEEAKAELWYALKKVLTKEQYAEFENARQEYEALPESVRRFSR